MGSGREHIDPRLLALIDKTQDTPWLLMKNLKVGDILEIQTKNSLKVVDPETGEVILNSKGTHDLKEANACVIGTTLTGWGTMIKLGHIAAGMRLIVVVKGIEGFGEMMLTSAQEVRVNGVKVLPIAPQN